MAIRIRYRRGTIPTKRRVKWLERDMIVLQLRAELEDRAETLAIQERIQADYERRTQ